MRTHINIEKDEFDKLASAGRLHETQLGAMKELNNDIRNLVSDGLYADKISGSITKMLLLTEEIMRIMEAKYSLTLETIKTTASSFKDTDSYCPIRK